MFLQIILLLIGGGAIGLGCKGFTAAGLPFSSRGNLTGAPAAFVGMMCILVGVTIIALPFLLSMAGEASRR